ncbi:MAG: hypothetical protein WD021_11090 [Rhodothermales bacterium]
MIETVSSKNEVQSAIADAFMSDEEYAEAYRRLKAAEQALSEAETNLEQSVRTLERVESDARETAIQREMGEASDDDVRVKIEAVDEARARSEELTELVEVRSAAAERLQQRFNEVRTQTKRRLSREWGEQYRERVQALIGAYHALEEANEAVQQCEYDIKLRTLRLPHEEASWNDPLVRPGGYSATHWLRRLKDVGYEV